jgi:hypothetical protein
MLNPYCNTNTLLNDQFNKSYEIVKTVYDNLSVLVSVNNRMTVIPTIAALRAFTSSENNQVIFLADSKNTEYKVDYSDAVTLDNGNTVIIGADGKRWKKILLSTENLTDVNKNIGFNPILYGTGITGTVTYTAQEGLYTKIGNLVNCVFVIGWSTFTGTGEVRIGALPFTASSSNNVLRYGFNVSYFENLNLPSGSTLGGFLDDNTNHIRLTQISNVNNVLQHIELSTSGKIYGSITYTI